MHLGSNLQLIIGCLVVLAVILVAGAFLASTPKAEKLAGADSVMDDKAVQSALLYAADDRKTGGIVGNPTVIRGATMTYSRAVQLIFGNQVDPTKDTVRGRDSLVWIVALEGIFVSHVPAAPGIPGIPSKEVTHTQMCLIIDGNTNDLIERVFVSPSTRIDVSSLPVLPLPGSRAVATPTKGTLVLDSPLATSTPVH